MTDKVIYKYTLRWVDTQLVEMPEDAEPLTVQMEGENLRLYVLCTPDTHKVKRPIRLEREGIVVSDPGRYIGTVQAQGLVFHAFAGWRRS